jgi:hypothetical protein
MYLARFQVRMLLGTPADERHVGFGGQMRTAFVWRCGCSAIEVQDERFRVMPCNQDAPLLACVSEDDERAHYDTLCKTPLAAVKVPRLRATVVRGVE